MRTTADAKGEGLDPVKLVLVPYKSITDRSCCGSSVLHVMSVCIWSSAIWFIRLTVCVFRGRLSNFVYVLSLLVLWVGCGM